MKNIEIRTQNKVELREKAKGYSCKTYEPDELWRHVIDLCKEIKTYKYQKDEDPSVLQSYRAELDNLKSKLFVDAPLTVRFSSGRVIRLNKSAVSEVMAVDYESRRPTEKLAVVNHSVQTVFDFSWRIFNNDPEEGQRLKDDFQMDIMNQLLWKGVVVVSNEGNRMMTIIGSSAGHQKAEKFLMGDSRLMKSHEKFFWFGRTMEEFVNIKTTSGAEFMKARANLLRPWMKPFEAKDGRRLSFRSILVVKDVAKVYNILNARRIGKKDGKMTQDGPTTEAVTVCDGGMLAVYPLKFQGQCSSVLFKGFMADATSSIVALCEKHDISVENFLNREVEGIDGKMHRIGDFAAICGEGCWKGDKVFDNYSEYCAWMEEMAKLYPGLDMMYLLRQAEEIEDEDKVRRLTRTLIQQWMYMSGKEIRQITLRTRQNLKKAKTFKGALTKLAALWRTEEERTECEKLFKENPWLICAPAIQNFLQESWEKKQVEAASGKFRTEGQYPYIMQDPVAVLEIWVLGMDVNDPTLGILQEGEASAADVPDGRKMLCVRFPANFLTAQVKINRACKEAYSSLNGVLVLSIHDLILIAQDGDVDGDEMCVIYNRLAIRLTERMQKEFNPPVVLFNHGGKPPRHIAGSKEAYVRDIAEALWRAKRYDSVGLYANLAMKCAYLAAIALKNGNTKDTENYLLWMSAASTGAILAIDQVKGNDVDASLIKWLDDIRNRVNKAMAEIAMENGYSKEQARKQINPFIQYYVAEAKRRPITKAECLDENQDNYLDQMAGLILRDTGVWENFDFCGTSWNEEAAYEALTNGLPKMRVPNTVVTKEMIGLLGDNWFKLRTSDEKDDATAPVLRSLKPGAPLELKAFVMLLWRNESSMAYTMEGRQLWEKKEEYYEACRQLLQMFVEGGDWSKKPVKVTKEERWEVLVNQLVRTALELGIKNDIDKKGSFAMFILKLIAPELRRNAKKNSVDQERFFGVNITEEELRIEAEQEWIDDEEELYESSSDYVDEEPVFTEEDLAEMERQALEELGC